jgi:hypothetical protein
MASQTILIIRHAEKPVPNGANGIDESGSASAESLTPEGWQRAGAWAEFFAPSSGREPALPTPTALFASNPDHHDDQATDDDQATANGDAGNSRRPLQTITPLAAKLDLEIDSSIAKRKVTKLAAALTEIDGVTLVCWQHEVIIDIVDAIAPLLPGVPDKWPGDRFNVIFRLDRPGEMSPWKFQQIVPVLLGGDPSKPI